MGQGRGKVAGGEGVESAKAVGEFTIGQLALAEERAEKIVGTALPLLRIAFAAGRDKVAVGIAPGLRKRYDVVETLHVWGEVAETIETTAGFARMDAVAQEIRAQEVLVFQVAGHVLQGLKKLVVAGVPKMKSTTDTRKLSSIPI